VGFRNIPAMKTCDTRRQAYQDTESDFKSARVTAHFSLRMFVSLHDLQPDPQSTV